MSLLSPRRLLLLGAALAPVPFLLFACGQDPTIVSVRNLERPTDMSFVCLTSTQPGAENRLSGRPMRVCHPSLAPDPMVDCQAARTMGTFGLVTNSSRGEVGVVDMNCGRLVDLDPGQPGFNMLPVGALPDVVASSLDGCQAVTANRGSCDLTTIDPSRLLPRMFGGAVPSSGAGPVTRRVPITTASGRVLAAAPQEVVYLPQPLAAIQELKGSEKLCSTDGAYQGGGRYEPWRAVVSFPGCDLVAIVELPSGKILSSVHVRPEGLVDAGTEPTCPAECGAGIVPSAEPVDAGAPADGGAPSGAGLRVGALALVPDGTRLYVGASQAPFVSAIDVMESGLGIPADGGRIPLAETPGGVTRLRLSVDPFTDEPGMSVGRFVGRRGAFLYAFARDGSVRVIDVGRRLTALDRKELECDVNVDPLAIPAGSRPLGCFTIDDPDPTKRPPARRPLAQGPGLRVPSISAPDLPPPIPRDIAFGQIGLFSQQTERPDMVVDGAYGFLLVSSGTVYLVNIDPAVRPGDPVPLTHSFRDLNNRAAFEGPPRVAGLPFRSFMVNDIAFPTRVPLGPSRGPRLEGPPTSDPAINPNASMERPANTWAVFPDPSSTVPQTWSVVWEDILPGTDRSTGEVASAGDTPGPAGALADLGADFCRAGVLRRDFVLFSGCQQDSQCTPRGRAVCRQALPGAPGLCVPAQRAKDETLLGPCLRHLASRRRYEVVRAGRTRLELGLKLDELPTTTLNRCTTNKDCELPGIEGFACVQVREDEPRRCVKPCAAKDMPPGTRDDKACRQGTVCEAIPGTLPEVGPLCVEGPPILAGCWPELASYKVQAGHTFMVLGGATPRMPTVREEGGECVLDPKKHPNVVNRIPLDAPHCANIADGTESLVALGQTPGSAPGMPGNPCLFRAANADEPPGMTPPPQKVKALLQNTQVRFLLTNLDEYAGDAAATSFEVIGGFFPTTVSIPGVTGGEDIVITLPTRILTGPDDSRDSPGLLMGGGVEAFNSFPHFYVVDQGRTVSSPNGRGQILRFTPRHRSGGLPRFDSIFTSFPFHVQ